MPTYPGVYPWIARCLQDSARNVGDAYFDLDVASEIRENLPSPLVYEDLADPDKGRFDEAIGLLVAARNRGPLATGGAGRELSSEKTETVARSFGGGVTQDEEWQRRARQLLAKCSFAPSVPTGGMVNLYAVNGPSRARRERERRYEE